MEGLAPKIVVDTYQPSWFAQEERKAKIRQGVGRLVRAIDVDKFECFPVAICQKTWEHGIGSPLVHTNSYARPHSPSNVNISLESLTGFLHVQRNFRRTLPRIDAKYLAFLLDRVLDQPHRRPALKGTDLKHLS
jgi:hypothetical protein